MSKKRVTQKEPAKAAVVATLAELKGDPSNPRAIDDAAATGLSRSLEEFGDISGITFNRTTRELVTGHQRCEQIRGRWGELPIEPVDPDLGIMRSPEGHVFRVRYVEWSKARQRAANVAANSDAIAGEFLDSLDDYLLEVQTDLATESPGLMADLLLDELFEAAEAEGVEHDPKPILNAATLADLVPTKEELAILEGKTLMVEFSGGKDSSAAAIWCRHYLPDADIKLVYVDLGADFYGFSLFLKEFAEWMGRDLTVIRSPLNIIDHFIVKGEWPHFAFPYCHELLHGAMDTFTETYDPQTIVIVRGGRLSEASAKTKNDKTKKRDTRWLAIERLADYRFFQPLYFSDKTSSERVITEAGAPLWDGYSRGLCRTACRICPGQKPRAYAAMRREFPDIWAELLALEKRLGFGCWRGQNEEGSKCSFTENADKGDTQIEAGQKQIKH